MRPEDTQGATYTISNVGSFGNLMGTPIIPQPQVAILAVGAIVKNLLYWKLRTEMLSQSEILCS